MESLLASKANGTQSPNFASRLRRKAVNKLMQAGLERKQFGPGPITSTFPPQNAPGINTPDTPIETSSDDDEFDPRRRSAMF